jgi:site-specific recombinase XerD
MVLSEAIDALAIATRADGRSPATVTAYRRKLKPLLDFLGNVEVETITVHDLRRYLADQRDRQTLYTSHPMHRERAGSLSPHTISGRVRTMKRLFNWLTTEGIITENPGERIRTPRPKRDEPKGISRADLLALLATCAGETVADVRDRAIILLLGDSGCRVGGLCGLRIGDLDLDAMRAWVTEKRDKTRLVFFLEHTAQALRAWLEIRPQGYGDWLFVSLSTNVKGALMPGGVIQMLKRRARQAGVPGPVNPHAFRHAYAREFLLSGGDLGTLADLMGHDDVSTTKAWYGVFTVRELQEKHRRHSMIARLLGGDDNGKTGNS